jgi:tRNA(Arg) A34 adenosine deaminase TadA
MEAIRAAAAKLGTSRLDECTLWVTLEPCAM